MVSSISHLFKLILTYLKTIIIKNTLFFCVYETRLPEAPLQEAMNYMEFLQKKLLGRREIRSAYTGEVRYVYKQKRKRNYRRK